ncbi:MAG: cysteine synthase family protein [Eubacteriales bacterium]|nr:cysteine synthase family protein [Eubacteriales bacterium]
MRVYNSMNELVGNTPMVRLNQFPVKEGINLYAKLELYNPGGSVKDRLGVYFIEDAEKSGKLHKGDTIIEATAGNTGLGIAFAAINKGYRVIFVVPTKFSEEKLALMRAFGAEVVQTPRALGMAGAEAKTEELLKEIPNSMSFYQFRNQANPMAHYLSTGPEIYEDMDGKIDYFIAGAGTGGTYTGVMRYFKEKNPNIKGVLADPVGSIIGGGTEHADYNIEGIGNDFIPDTMDVSLIDIAIKVTDDEAYSMAREIAKREGIIAGTSSGADLVAALKLAETIDKGNIVILFPDRGDRYISKHIYG